MREEAEGRRNWQDDRQWIQEVVGTQESRWPRDGTGDAFDYSSTHAHLNVI